MNDVLEGMDGISPSDIAERWFARLMAPDCSTKERAQFEQWLRQQPENALAFEDTKALWASLGGLDEDEGIAPYTVTALEPETDSFMEQWTTAAAQVTRPVKQKPRRAWMTIASAIAALLVVGVVAWPRRTPEAPVVPYLAADTIRDIKLPDGSDVQLDIQTAMSVKLSPERRDIALAQGRAMFEVAHDAKRPFVVDAGAGRITAIGTRFQVQRRPGTVSVTLLEGSVGIESGLASEGTRMLRLSPGQSARYTETSKMWTVASVDASAATSWSQGFHVFSSTPLAEAVEEINRYSSVKLSLTDPSLAKLTVSGSFKLGDGRAIAEALPFVLPVSVSGSKDIAISRRKR